MSFNSIKSFSNSKRLFFTFKKWFFRILLKYFLSKFPFLQFGFSILTYSRKFFEKFFKTKILHLKEFKWYLSKFKQFKVILSDLYDPDISYISHITHTTYTSHITCTTYIICITYITYVTHIIYITHII